MMMMIRRRMMKMIYDTRRRMFMMLFDEMEVVGDVSMTMKWQSVEGVDKNDCDMRRQGV